MGLCEPVARSFLDRIGVLFCLLLYVMGTGVVAATGMESMTTSVEQQQIKQTDRPGQAVLKSPVSGLEKVLTSKSARRTDIPEALLIVMLALIGVVVIARRSVSGKDRKAPLKTDER